MKRPSYANKIILSVIGILFLVIFILGTSILVVMIDDVNESEQLLNYSKQAYKDSIDIMFEDYDNISGSILRSSYVYLNEIAKEYLRSYHGDALSESFSEEKFIKGYFLVNEAGQVEKDTTGLFKGNLLTMKDDAGDPVAQLYRTSMDEHKQVKFEAQFNDRMYYSLLRKLDDEYMLGLTMSADNAERLFTNQLKETASLLPDTVVTDLEIVSLEDMDEMQYFKYPLQVIREMSEAETDEVIEYRSEQYLLFYKILNNKWLIIFESQLITDLESKFEEIMNTQSKQLVTVSHAVVLVIIFIGALLVLLSKRIKKQLHQKIEILENNPVYDKAFAEQIKYDEFYRIYSITKNNKPQTVVVECNHDHEENLFYMMGLIKQHYIQRHLNAALERFKFSEVLNKLLSDLMIESTLFEVNIIDDTEADVYQNKSLIEGLMLYTIVSLLIYGNSKIKNIIRIEAVEYQDQIIVEVSRNKILDKQHLLYEMIEEFDVIDELIHLGLNGQLDYSKYETPNRLISIHIPKEKLTE